MFDRPFIVLLGALVSSTAEASPRCAAEQLEGGRLTTSSLSICGRPKDNLVLDAGPAAVGDDSRADDWKLEVVVSGVVPVPGRRCQTVTANAKSSRGVPWR